MKNKVSIIEKIIPVTNTIPIVSLDSYPAPDPIRRGATPITVENPVIIIGLNLILHASIMELYELFPFIFICLANSTIKIPFLADIPINIINPIWLKIFNEFSKRVMEASGAINVSGTDSIIINGNL